LVSDSHHSNPVVLICQKTTFFISRADCIETDVRMSVAAPVSGIAFVSIGGIKTIIIILVHAVFSTG
jgi:hypothetical protein